MDDNNVTSIDGEQLTNKTWSDTKSESFLPTNQALGYFHKEQHLKLKEVKLGKITKESYPPIYKCLIY